MGISIRVSKIIILFYLIFQQSAYAITMASIIHCSKICTLAILKKTGPSIMIWTSRIVNQGTSLALDGSYNQSLLRRFADVLNDSRSELLCAVIKNKDDKAVEFLIDPKACWLSFQGTAHDPTLLHVALRAKNFTSARILLQFGMDPNAVGEGAFDNECLPLVVEFARDLEALKLLVEFGAKLDWRGKDGASIYSDLFKNAEWESIRFLHDSKAELSAHDYLVAIAHKDKLIEYNLNNFMHTLAIKAPTEETTGVRVKNALSQCKMLSKQEQQELINFLQTQVRANESTE